MHESTLRLLCATPDLRPTVLPVLRGLHRGALLDTVVTTLAVDAEGRPYGVPRALPKAATARVARVLKRRILPSLPGVTVDVYPSREAVRLLVDRTLRHEILTDSVWWWSERGFDRYVARRWAGRLPFTYGFEVASADTFRAQKAEGGGTILDQVIAHHRTALAILREELEAHPDASTPYLQHLLLTSPRVNAVKDEQFASSDLIVANSTFVRDSFIAAGISGDRIAVVPGAGPRIELPDLDTLLARRVDPAHPALFVAAGHLSVRKGTHYLLEAWRRIGPRSDAHLLLVGHDMLPASLKEGLPENVTIRPTMGRDQLFQLFRGATALVLPSLCEGFATVILEALANALPVITTPNSGCSDFVRDGQEGWIIPIRDPDALAERLTWSIEHRNELAEMGRKGRIRSSAWTWDEFALVHADLIRRFMSSYASGSESSPLPVTTSLDQLVRQASDLRQRAGSGADTSPQPEAEAGS